MRHWAVVLFAALTVASAAGLHAAAQPPATKPSTAPGKSSIAAPGKTPDNASLNATLNAADIRTLMQQVSDHQKSLDKVRENYTWHTASVTEEMDKNGQVTKTERSESDVFFVNGHQLERTVSKDGKPLTGKDADKEQERINKLAEKAQNTPPDKPLDSSGAGFSITISRLLEIMDVTNPRRESFRGRPTIIFDLVGKHDAKTHGVAEDVSKKIAATIWVDEKDREIARMEAHFTDNFHLMGGMLANVGKGSIFNFDQALVNGEIWLPVAAEGHVDVRFLMVKGLHVHFTEKDTNYQRYRVDAEPGKAASPAHS